MDTSFTFTGVNGGVGEVESGLDEEEGKWSLKAFTKERRETLVMNWRAAYSQAAALVTIFMSLTLIISNSHFIDEILCHYLVTPRYIMYKI